MLKKAVWMGVLAIGSLTTSGCVVERYLGGEGGSDGEGGHATIGTGEGAGGCGAGEVSAVGGHAEGGGSTGEGGFSEGGGSTGEGGFSEGGGGPGTGGEGGFSEGGGGPGTGGAGGAEECATCASQPIFNVSLPFCDELSAQIHDALVVCICESTCGDLCGDTVCAGQPGSEACQDCMLSPQGCGAEFQACTNDT